MLPHVLSNLVHARCHMATEFIIPKLMTDADAEATDYRLLNEWLTLAPLRGTEPVVVVFARHIRDWFKPDDSCTMPTTLAMLNDLSAALKALSADPLKPSRENELGHRPSKNHVEPLVRSILPTDEADEFLGVYNIYYWSTGIVRACTWGRMDYVSEDLRDSLFNYIEVKGIAEGTIPIDLYDDAYIQSASRSYIFAQSFLSDLVPEFVRFLGEVPSNAQVLELIADKQGRERMLALAQYGAEVMHRFVKTLELLPTSVVTEQIQAFRDLTAMPYQLAKLQSFIVDREEVQETEPFKVGMNLLGAVIDSLPKTTEFNRHLARITYAAEHNPFDDLGNLNFG